MFIRTLIRQCEIIYKYKTRIKVCSELISRRYLHVSVMKFRDRDDTEQKNALKIRDPFDEVNDKNKQTYLQMINIFMDQESVYRRGHVEFIYAALKHMKDFGVQHDLEVYTALIDVLPKGKFVPTNMIQSEYMHYPKQQQCIIDLLTQMEENNVMPTFDMEDQLVAIFGRRGYPVRRYWRMMYWMPKWKFASPFPIPDPLPKDTYELAKIAIERISNVDPTNQVTIYHTADIKEAIDDTWIVSAQSVTQKHLLSENDPKDPVFIEGPFTLFLRGNYINYFILRGKAKPFDDSFEDPDNVENIKASYFNYKPPMKSALKVIPSVHEQDDGVIYSLCATGTSTKDSLLSWIRHLENDGNEVIAKLQIVFTLKTPTSEVTKAEDKPDQGSEPKEIKDS